MKKFINCFNLCIVMFFVSIYTGVFCAEPAETKVFSAMRKSSDFMVNTVSNRGGYLWYYAAGLSDQWGEAPARSTQIWVQGGTPNVGMMFLDVYKTTGDEYYLRCAEKSADALIYGQHPLGGWHYFIDFDMTGLEKWYREVFSQFRGGMEEYRHYYGNCTFDDNVTQGATLFLLKLYMTTLNPVYRGPLLKALDFILAAQYPNGGLPQRYPLRYEFAHDGIPDYTSYYTLNDGALRNVINVLIEAYENLGNEEYLKAALRGADFITLAQTPEPYAAWAEQYDMDVKPAWGRTHEPPSVQTRETKDCISALENIYLMTGDRRYLSPIPKAIRWLETSTQEIRSDGLHKLARYYEPGTNLPIYKHNTGEVNEQGYALFRYDNIPSGGTGSWAGVFVDVKRIKKEFERINALTPEEAVAEYKAKRNAKPLIPKIDPEDVNELINSMNERGAWIEDISVHDVTKTMTSDNNRKTIKGISTSSFVRNMYTFIHYLKQVR